MKVLIVDDERLARERLAFLLEDLPEVTGWADAKSAEHAESQIHDFNPDVVLLDIHMPGCSGVAYARTLPDSIGVVFVTADPSHAVAAFELGAFDYVVKPVRGERLQQALKRANQRREPTPLRLRARSSRGFRFFDAHRIPRFTAQDKYVVFQVEGEEFLLEDSLDRLEDLLPHLRIHRGELVDLSAVAGLEGNIVELRNGQRATVSRRKLPEVRRILRG